MMKYFLLICTNPNENADELLSKLKTSDKWELTLDAGNIVPGYSATFRINTNLSYGDVEAELIRLSLKPMFLISEIHTPGTK